MNDTEKLFLRFLLLILFAAGLLAVLTGVGVCGDALGPNIYGGWPWRCIQMAMGSLFFIVAGFCFVFCVAYWKQVA